VRAALHTVGFALFAVFVVLAAGCGARSTLTPVLHPPPVDLTIARACQMYYSCSGWQGLLQPSEGQGVSKCIASSGSGAIPGPSTIATGFLQETSAACLAAAQDCQGVTGCIFGSPRACFEPPSSSFCRAGYAVHCIGDLGSAGESCALPGFLRDGGATCMRAADGNAVCGFGACDASSAPVCDGVMQLTCQAGVLTRFTCPPGTACDPASLAMPHSQGVACTGTGAPCTGDRCDGADVVSCLNGGEWRHGCNGAGGVPSVCSFEPSGIATCTPDPDLACDPTQYVDRCDGAKLVYCDGDVRRVDCASLGFTSCTTESGGWAGCH
jgi:hypothetical protein